MGIGRVMLAAAAGAAVVVSAVSAQAEDYKVVVLQSLTGGAAFIGASVKDGAVLAADELNEKNFLGEGNKLVYEVADDATDRTQTLSLITRYAADPSVLAVMGPTSGAVALAGANVANEREIPVMTTTNSMEVVENGPWSFILTQPAFVTIPYLADYAADVLGVKNCAIIGIKDIEAYVALQREFEKQIQAKGVKLASVDGVAGTDSDFSALATKIASSQQDCVFVGAPASQGANIILQLRQAGLDPSIPILGHNAFASPAFVEKGGGAVEGVYLIGSWVPGGFDDFSTAFAESFKKETGAAADNWNAVGYSGMQVIAHALKDAGPHPDRAAVRDALAKVKDVPVVVGQGSYSYDDKRVPHFGMNVLTVKDGQFVQAPR